MDSTKASHKQYALYNRLLWVLCLYYSVLYSEELECSFTYIRNLIIVIMQILYNSINVSKQYNHTLKCHNELI